MRLSTKHLLAQRVIALMAFLVIIGALKIWPIPLLEELPCWVGLLAFAIFAGVIVSSIGFGPWGHYVNKLAVLEDEQYRESLKPKQPWQ
jgi:hypothetical protein